MGKYASAAVTFPGRRRVIHLVVGRGKEHAPLGAEAASVYSLLVALHPSDHRPSADVPQEGRLVLAAGHEAGVVRQNRHVQHLIPINIAVQYIGFML